MEVLEGFEWAGVEEREWRQREQLEGLRAAWAGAVPGMVCVVWPRTEGEEGRVED